MLTGEDPVFSSTTSSLSATLGKWLVCGQCLAGTEGVAGRKGASRDRRVTQSVAVLATPIPPPPAPGPHVWGLCFCVLDIRKCLEGSEEPSWGRKVDFPVTGYIFYTPTRCSELG